MCQYAASELAAYDQQWPSSPEEIKQITRWFASDDTQLAVCLRETDRLIGFVSLAPEPAEGERVFSLGYVFSFDYHGRGYATEACQAVLSHAFNGLLALRVVTGTAAANHASCRLLDRLGFRQTSENITSFRNAPNGAPIEFIGCSYELTRETCNLRTPEDPDLTR
jgi:RimJ/RimL family protein N-acetyltransferase